MMIMMMMITLMIVIMHDDGGNNDETAIWTLILPACASVHLLVLHVPVSKSTNLLLPELRPLDACFAPLHNKSHNCI